MSLDHAFTDELARLPQGTHLRVVIGAQECTVERLGDTFVAWVATGLDQGDLIPALLDVAARYPGAAQLVTVGGRIYACLLGWDDEDTLGYFVERYAGRGATELGLPPATLFTSTGAR